MTIDKVYHPEEIEQHWYQVWENNNYFAPSGEGEPYCILLPPPNVTGTLHMGHGFIFTLMDVLVRYQRMCGKNTLWQTGTDHAGIATQMVVERNLNREGKTRHDLGRDKFVEKIWAWKETSGGTITRQLRRLGASMDWSRERFTLDPELSFAVREVFIRLFEEGLVYRGKKLVNWDPALLTAISDLEVVSEEESGKLWHIRYPLADNNGHLIVATTRPETLLGDVAVAVHPDDERYQALIGKKVHLPLTDRTIPIIADTYVDPLFGTGCVKITPAHDFNDYLVGQRHHLEPINIFTVDAHLNENVPPKYQGLERFKAREQLIRDLESLNLLEKVEAHRLKVPRGEKSGVVIEPYLTHQWFMKMSDLARPAIDAVRDGRIKFIPDNWNKTYFQWMENIEDWCISRQLWWGHRIPVWYDHDGRAYVGHDEIDVRKRNGLDSSIKLVQDEDVLDTWFSSALWPFSTLGWPNKTKELDTYFPTNVLITGFDIIFFWVARMIMMSLKIVGDIPFQEIYITGLIRDAEGQKMSKSKGNVIDPIDLIDGISLDNLIQKRTYGLMQPSMAQKIEKATRKEFSEGIPSYGTDALRFTFCAQASYTREIRFDIHKLSGYRNFCNKLWNASRYVLMNTEEKEVGNLNQPFSDKYLSLPDKWILSLLQDTIVSAHLYLKQYRFDLYAQTLYDFTWNEFCDWYLELSKPILNSIDIEENYLTATRNTLIRVLDTLLKLLHPIMPFITEEIWQKLPPTQHKTNTSIMLQQFPEANVTFEYRKEVKTIEWIKKVIIAIRTIRSEMNIAPGKLLPILLRKGNEEDRNNIVSHEKFLKTLAKLSSIHWLTESETLPPSASAFVNDLEIFIPMADLINVSEEKTRLIKEKARLEKDFLIAQNKLSNPTFIEKAPPHVVEQEKMREADLKKGIQKIESQLEELKSLDSR